MLVNTSNVYVPESPSFGKFASKSELDKFVNRFIEDHAPSHVRFA